MTMTRVIDVHGCRPEHFKNSPGFVYVGRAVYYRGWRYSPWANPFRVGDSWSHAARILESRGGPHRWDNPRLQNHVAYRKDHWGRRLTLDDALDSFQVWLEAIPDYQKRVKADLAGKILGCWCCDWSPGMPEYPCHAVRLALIADMPEITASLTNPESLKEARL